MPLLCRQLVSQPLVSQLLVAATAAALTALTALTATSAKTLPTKDATS